MPDYFFAKLSSYQWVVNIKTKMIAVFFAALGMAVDGVDSLLPDQFRLKVSRLAEFPPKGLCKFPGPLLYTRFCHVSPIGPGP